jgi:hypothetical protein
MLPQAIPQPAPPPTGTGGEIGTGTGTGGGTPPPPPPPPPPTPTDTKVELTFTSDRNQLFAAWNAVANLADMAGQVTVTVKAEKPDGFDKGKLSNGVIEPLREADLIQ